jgi:LacI family transcriptional regulator
MVREHQMWPARIPVEAVDVVERMSTKHRTISDPHIRKIVEFINHNYRQDIEIEKLVSFIPLSRRSIEMKFKKEMRPYTIKSYLTKLRINHFCHLLESTSIPIREAAEQSGFIESSNFSTIFRKYKGVTPSAYRNKHRSDVRS